MIEPLVQAYRAFKAEIDKIAPSIMHMAFEVIQKPLTREQIRNEAKRYVAFRSAIDAVIDIADDYSPLPDVKPFAKKVIDLITPEIDFIKNDKTYSKWVDEKHGAQEAFLKIGATVFTSGKDLKPENKMRFVFAAFNHLRKEMQQYSDLENDLPPLDVETKSAAAHVVLMDELGIIDFLTNKYNLPAQRMGELLKLITGKKTDSWRERISNKSPENWRAFTPKSKQEVKAILSQFGID